MSKYYTWEYRICPSTVLNFPIEPFFSSEKRELLWNKIKGRYSIASEEVELGEGHHCPYRSAFVWILAQLSEKSNLYYFTQRWLSIKLYDRLSNERGEESAIIFPLSDSTNYDTIVHVSDRVTQSLDYLSRPGFAKSLLYCWYRWRLSGQRQPFALKAHEG